eukprot:jgi/Mesen1/4370/ME000221S03498
MALQESCGSETRPGDSSSRTACGSESWDVYVCYRPLREVPGDFYSRLPPHVKTSLRDLGVCHFMTIFKSSSGQLVQFDFGPRGGDIVMDFPGSSRSRRRCNSKMACIQQLQRENITIYAGPKGEIREEQLEMLPETAIYIGPSSANLHTVRQLNAGQNLFYELNENDCRHYVDMVIKQTTGLDRASAFLMRENARRRNCSPHSVQNRLLGVVQLALEKDNTAIIAGAGRFSLLTTVVAASLRLGARHTACSDVLTRSMGLVARAVNNVPLVGRTLGRAFMTVGRQARLLGNPRYARVAKAGVSKSLLHHALPAAVATAGSMSWVSTASPKIASRVSALCQYFGLICLLFMTSWTAGTCPSIPGVAQVVPAQKNSLTNLHELCCHKLPEFSGRMARSCKLHVNNMIRRGMKLHKHDNSASPAQTQCRRAGALALTMLRPLH